MIQTMTPTYLEVSKSPNPVVRLSFGPDSLNLTSTKEPLRQKGCLIYEFLVIKNLLV